MTLKLFTVVGVALLMGVCNGQKQQRQQCKFACPGVAVAEIKYQFKGAGNADWTKQRDAQGNFFFTPAEGHTCSDYTTDQNGCSVAQAVSPTPTPTANISPSPAR